VFQKFAERGGCLWSAAACRRFAVPSTASVGEPALAGHDAGSALGEAFSRRCHAERSEASLGKNGLPVRVMHLFVIAPFEPRVTANPAAASYAV
jgi:hypothetical protein